MGGSREHFSNGNCAHVVIHRPMHVGQGFDGSLRPRPRAGPNRRGAFRRSAPAAFRFVECGIEFTPLATGEEGPFEGILKSIIIVPLPAPGQFGARSADVETVENRMMPGSIIGALANQPIELAPVTWRDFLRPLVEIPQNQPHPPERACISDLRQKRKRLFDSAMRLFLARPLWKLR